MRTTPGAAPPIDTTLAPKARPRRELVIRALQPVVAVLVRAGARAGVHPQAVVLTHGAIGLVAAGLIVVDATGAAAGTAAAAAGAPPAAAAGTSAAAVAAALALQLRSLLDNVDGGLARVTGRVTKIGRYLDSTLDTVVNAVLFAALALHASGPLPWPLAWLLAATAFAVSSLVLSLDYNLECRYKVARGQNVPVEPNAPLGGPAWAYRLVKGAYDRVLAPQDRLVCALDDALFEHAVGTDDRSAPTSGGGSSGGGTSIEHRLAWSDHFSTGSVVNLGQTTQMLVLGVCLLLGAPFVFVVLVLAGGAYVAVVQLVRVARFRRYLEAP